MRFPDRSSWAAWTVVGGLIALAAPGCASLRFKPAADHVIAARERTREGIDALDRNELDAAESQFRQAVEISPSDKDARRHFAEILWRLGKPDQAIVQMHEAVRLSNGDPDLLVRLGEMELIHGRAQVALERSEAALVRSRSLAAAWALKGDALRQLDQRAEAIASYHRALSCQEQMPRVQLALGEMYLQAGRPQRSLATLHALAEQYAPDETPQEALHLEGLALGAMGRHDDAVASLTKAVRRGGASAELLCHLAEAHLALGDAANARLAIEQAMAASPDHAASRRLAARIDDLRRVAALPQHTP